MKSLITLTLTTILLVTAICLHASHTDSVTFSAKVEEVTQQTFPYVKLKLKDIRAPKIFTADTILATPAFKLSSGAVDYRDPGNIANFSAYYFQQGDAVRGELFTDQKPDGSYFVTKIVRIASPKLESAADEKLISSVRTNKRQYGVGEPVTMTLTVENLTNEDINLSFPSGRKYDFWVMQDGKEVWRWSRSMAFTQAVNFHTLQSKNKLVYEIDWNQRSNDGKQIAAGSYQAFAQLASSDPKQNPVETGFTVHDALQLAPLTTIRAITDNIEANLGKTVRISGTYLGWRPDTDYPACQGGPPMTRSDWAISDETGCIYVSGGGGLNPTKDYGSRISISGEVSRNDRGQVYIKVGGMPLR